MGTIVGSAYIARLPWPTPKLQTAWHSLLTLASVHSYDSAGICIDGVDNPVILKATGKIDCLAEIADEWADSADNVDVADEVTSHKRYWNRPT